MPLHYILPHYTRSTQRLWCFFLTFHSLVLETFLKLYNIILLYNSFMHSPPPLASWILHSLVAAAATHFRDEPSWLFAAVSEMLISSLVLFFLHFLPWYAHVAQPLPLHLSQCLTSNSCSSLQSLVFPRLIVRYSWWRRSLWMIFMVQNFTHGIYDPLSCTGTQWPREKVMIN